MATVLCKCEAGSREQRSGRTARGKMKNPRGERVEKERGAPIGGLRRPERAR
jgi:hypothetical protein